jgi:hypothetical protein
MNRLRLAAWVALASLGLAMGCASPCNEGFFGGHSWFRRGPTCCPAPCESGCCPGAEGPILGDGMPGMPGMVGAPVGGVPAPVLPPGAVAPGVAQPAPVPDRLLPVPQPIPGQPGVPPAAPAPAAPSSRQR